MTFLFLPWLTHRVLSHMKLYVNVWSLLRNTTEFGGDVERVVESSFYPFFSQDQKMSVVRTWKTLTWVCFFLNIYLYGWLSLSGGLRDLSPWRMRSVAPWHVGILDPGSEIKPISPALQADT